MCRRERNDLGRPLAPPGQEGRTERHQEILRSIRQARRGGGAIAKENSVLDFDRPPRLRRYGSFAKILDGADPPLLARRGKSHACEVLLMLNTNRREQYLNLMASRSWDHLLLYGHAWRKDYFRSLINFSFFGPLAAASLSKSGELSILASHPWDAENLKAALDADIIWSGDFNSALTKFTHANTAIAGMELMEARFVEHFSSPVSATLAVEELRRFKTPEEIETARRAAHLADLGYQHFVHTAEVGMAEYELAAEVEGFLKTRGVEHNFMLIGSGGTEVYGMKPPTDRRFQKGDSITTELSPQVDGYYAQICRTLVLGEPSEDQRRSFEIFREAQQSAEDFLKPGVNI